MSNNLSAVTSSVFLHLVLYAQHFLFCQVAVVVVEFCVKPPSELHRLAQYTA